MLCSGWVVTDWFFLSSSFCLIQFIWLIPLSNSFCLILFAWFFSEIPDLVWYFFFKKKYYVFLHDWFLSNSFYRKFWGSLLNYYNSKGSWESWEKFKWEKLWVPSFASGASLSDNCERASSNLFLYSFLVLEEAIFAWFRIFFVVRLRINNF